jgi:RHS repeat-associated protein
MLTGPNRTLTWAAANMPASVAEPGKSLAFAYDTERSRIRQVVNSSGTETTTYWNDPTTGAKAEYVDGSATTQWRDYVFAAGGIAVISIREVPKDYPLNVTFRTRYIHRDYLGSTNAVTDETGTLLEHDGYDPWGKRRNPDGTDDPEDLIASQTDKGFTGHEHLQEVALINMGGRIYDPLVGRFTSPDSVVQSAMNSQSFNRYTYGYNNPLSYIDPTGHFSFNPFKTLTHVFNGVTNGLSPVFHNQLVQAAEVIVAAVACSVGGGGPQSGAVVSRHAKAGVI